MAVWKLTYTEKEGECRPFLFFAAFGEESLSGKAGLWEGSLPEGLAVLTGPAEYYREGVTWNMVCREQSEVASRIREVTHAVTVKGEILNPPSLDYLRETLEYLTYLTEQGAVAVYDPLQLRWFTAVEWQTWAERGSIFNPSDHVALLSSPEPDGGTWLHTRGLLKFGRPDLSVHGVADEEIDLVVKMLDRFINYQALGGVIETGRQVVMQGLEAVYRPGPIEGCMDDPDFNNTHVEIMKD